MFNNFISTYSEALWDFLKPRALVESIHACLRVVSDSMRNAENLISSEYNPNGSASTGFSVEIPVSNIQPASGVAGIDGCDTSSVAGEPVDDNYAYFVSGLPENMVMIGKSPDSSLSLLFTDFIPHGDGYLFRISPSKLGTISNKEGNVVISFYIVGGAVENRHQSQFRLIYDKTVNKSIYDAAKHSTTKALVCAGINNVPVKASAGITVVQNEGEIVKSWKEGATSYSCTRSELLKCPSTLSYDNIIGLPVEAGDTIEDSEKQDLVVFPVDGKWYWLSNDYLYDISVIAGLPDEYPDLDLPADVESLVAETKKRAIVTIDASYCKLFDTDLKVLSRYTPAVSSLHIVKILEVELSKDQNRITRGVSSSAVDSLYVFYTNSADIPRRSHCAGATSVEFLNTHFKESGCWRITSCVNVNADGRRVYGITSNSDIFGNLPTATSKIYGIAAVIGGNNYEDDIIYSYCTVPPVLAGSGVEMAIVGTL